MRIRKRPPRAVEAARAVPLVGGKPESVPQSLHAEVNITCRSERLNGGCLEAVSHVEIEVRPFDRAAVEGKPEGHPNSNSEHVEEDGVENGNGEKKEDSSSGGSELLMKSLLVVFERAGIRGLTAREAVAKLIEYDLPGLQEGERSSVQVSKVLRTPDFVHLEDGKYFIYPSTPHAVVAESSTHSAPSQQNSIFQAREDVSGNSPNFNNGSRRKRGSNAAAATKMASAVQQKENASDGSKDNILDFPDKVLSQTEKVELKKRRRRPPSSQHELAIGPRQCKRYDGRGWQCSKETEEGFSFCEHHQALMNKRTLRLNLAKMRRKGGSDKDMDAESQPKTVTVEGSSGNSNDQVMVAPHGIEDLIHNQRRKLVKARSLKSIK
ncbi:hypothetical protein KC19_12G098100 [Ceratodon purpureus]|uniref:WRC domain-containing protein n=1 Tax=Ceratodon purpureus TaxID=3225 RepID=A0A8T0G652_CERPU|nr:hypothetical protein KC19_12G098100 [Ceratodon purpureus]